MENKIVRAPFDEAILLNTVELGSIIGTDQEIAQAFTDGQLVVDVNISEAEAALIPGLFDGAARRSAPRIRRHQLCRAAGGAQGARILVSRIAVPVEGMALRVLSFQAGPPAQAALAAEE